MAPMLSRNHEEPSRSRRLLSKPVAGLFALAALLLCLEWVLPHHHAVGDDRDCALCLVTSTPADAIHVPSDGVAIDRDLPHERPTVWDSSVPEGPALSAPRPRGPPLA
jgi:hypothetical protein